MKNENNHYKLKSLSLNNKIKIFKNNWVLKDKRTILKECEYWKKYNPEYSKNIDSIKEIVDSDNDSYIEIYGN